MQNSFQENHYNNKIITNSVRNMRRTSLSGFENPLCIQPVFETKYANNIQSNMNGIAEMKSEMSNQNFYSENNINSQYQNQHNHVPVNNVDSRPNFSESCSFPRISSTPMIPQVITKSLNGTLNFVPVPVNCNQSFPLSSTSNNIQLNSNGLMYRDPNTIQCYQPFILCDSNMTSHRDILYYSNIDNVDMYCNSFQNNSSDINYPIENDLVTLQQFDSNIGCFKCQLSMTQDNFESGFVANDSKYYVPVLPTLQDPQLILDEMERVETQSMPSLHDDDNSDSDLHAVDTDKMNTVHGHEMSQELKMIADVLKDSADMPRNCNISRFKKTRIEERRTIWQGKLCLVIDTMVKIVPETVAHIGQLDAELMEKFELENFGSLLSKQEHVQKMDLESPECFHSVCRCRSSINADGRFVKHSHRPSRIYRTSYNSPSPNDLNASFNISSHRLRRKSSHKPVRIPFAWSPFNPIFNSAVPNCNRVFFDSPNISANKKPTRRWSFGSTKYEKNSNTFGVRPQTLRQPSDTSNRIRSDSDNRLPFELADLNECSDDHDSCMISSKLEAQLDQYLMSIKRTVMSQLDMCLREMREEKQMLLGLNTKLQHDLDYIKDRVQFLESSIRQNLPEDSWILYGVMSNVRDSS